MNLVILKPVHNSLVLTLPATTQTGLLMKRTFTEMPTSGPSCGVTLDSQMCLKSIYLRKNWKPAKNCYILRCAHLVEKKAEIDATIKAHKQWCEEAKRVYWQKYEESLPEDVQQQCKELWAAQKILADGIIEEAH
jgi:hypothetical protein